MKSRIIPTLAFLVLAVVLNFGSAHAGYLYTTLDYPGAYGTAALGIYDNTIVGGYIRTSAGGPVDWGVDVRFCTMEAYIRH